ncbi:hypothetical protein [Thermoanaerobacterium thermosaccharolyticum]|uniref:hypothetical protein n=1 Tax=Thermoanaerobacterium thermosaccharolyticum TaxID=1517 RepID=UPI001784EA4D|nr:hypothetical protein [Thermoanaerobacterium thermosaccharolyticum]MBE0069918.1 hypothetical protein [Thermoanaerobacterium thermosaccharolyticum]MBE0228046.1 hypothetical protein [Thermoanaerobacterium thermosaccharolyticum]
MKKNINDFNHEIEILLGLSNSGINFSAFDSAEELIDCLDIDKDLTKWQKEFLKMAYKEKK